MTTPTVTISRELADAVINSLGSFCSDHGWEQQDMDNMDSLISALNAEPQPEQGERAEVIALLKQGASISRERGTNLDFAKLSDRAAALLQSSHPEPQTHVWSNLEIRAIQDYARAAIAQSKQVPLTEKEIDKLQQVAAATPIRRVSFFISFARSIEAAHGIGAAPQAAQPQASEPEIDCRQCEYLNGKSGVKYLCSMNCTNGDKFTKLEPVQLYRRGV